MKFFIEKQRNMKVTKENSLIFFIIKTLVKGFLNRTKQIIKDEAILNILEKIQKIYSGVYNTIML